MLPNKRQSNFKVIVRVRPLSSKEKEEIQLYEQFCNRKGKSAMCKTKLVPLAYAFYSKYFNVNVNDMIKVTNGTTVTVLDQQYKNTQRKFRDYTFANVHQAHETNRNIFQKSLRTHIASVLQGYNCTVLAYGITGSGKTYSVFGHPKIEADQGISFLAYQYLLLRKKQIQAEDKANKVSFGFSFIEIYNENIRDLLTAETRKSSAISEDSKGNVILIDVQEIPIQSLEQLCKLINLGANRRMFASTNYNQLSSRSHAILKLSVQITRNHQSFSSKLFIIDLAGSEKIHMESSVRKQQGSNINKSLLALGNCITALADVRKVSISTHIPYRDSKLTRMLKDSLGGNAKTIMIGCISPHPFTIEETVTTLNYAQRAQGIKKEVVRNNLENAVICSVCQEKIVLDRHFEEEKVGQIDFENLDVTNEKLLLSIYNDMIENASEGQKLKRLKQDVENYSLQEVQALLIENQSEKCELKKIFLALVTNCGKSLTQVQHKPEKKRIHLTGSLRKVQNDGPKQENQEEKENLNGYFSAKKNSYSEACQFRSSLQESQDTHRSSSKQVKCFDQSNIEPSPIRRKSKSKFEIVKKPPLPSIEAVIPSDNCE